MPQPHPAGPGTGVARAPSLSGTKRGVEDAV